MNTPRVYISAAGLLSFIKNNSATPGLWAKTYFVMNPTDEEVAKAGLVEISYEIEHIEGIVNACKDKP